MIKKPFFSIIIASYNSRSMLAQTLESLRGQTFKNFEVIIIDGASKDGTFDLMAIFCDPMYRWLSEPDSGIYDAWNKGVQLARGSWIGFLGAGDFYLTNALQEYARLLNKYPELDYVSSRVELFDNRGYSRVIGKPWKWGVFKRYMCVAHVGSMHSSRIFKTYGGFDQNYRITGDYEFLLRSGAKLRADFLGLTLARMRAGGISSVGNEPLTEALQAKIKSKAVNKYIAYWDFVCAVSKVQLRRWFGHVYFWNF